MVAIFNSKRALIKFASIHILQWCHMCIRLEKGCATCAAWFIDTNLLLATLCQNGMCGTVFKWFQSYLTNRSQQINISSSCSSHQELACGVPQGSVLGPSLFTVYTESLGRLLHSLNIQYHLYAEDTERFVSFKPNVSSQVSETV